MMPLQKQLPAKEMAYKSSPRLYFPLSKSKVENILKNISRWKVRLNFWDQEFKEFERIANLQLKGHPKYQEAFLQHFTPLQTAMEEEMPKLAASLQHIEKRLLLMNARRQETENLQDLKWNLLENYLDDFEKDYRFRKKNFLVALYFSLPLNIY